MSRAVRVARHQEPAALGSFTGGVVRAEATAWVVLIDAFVAALRWLGTVACRADRHRPVPAPLRPWPVTARRLGRSRRVHLWSVRGRAASNDLLAEIVDSLRDRSAPPAG